MATDNRGVMVYLPSEVEVKMVEYCTQHNITRKDKQGNIVTSLGSGIVAYLKSQLLGDIPRVVSDRPTTGLTREEVIDLIAESSTGNTPIVGVASLAENRSPDPLGADVLHRLETIEQQLSSPIGISRDEVEQLIQSSEQRVMEAVRSLQGELAKIKAIDERVSTPQSSSSRHSQKRASEDAAINSPATDTESIGAIPGNKPPTKDIKRWLEPLKDNKFSDIIQTAVAEKLSNQEIVTRLYDSGYGKNNNTEPYPPNLASAMKTALLLLNN